MQPTYRMEYERALHCIALDALRWMRCIYNIFPSKQQKTYQNQQGHL